MQETQFRPISEAEKRVVLKMLELDFPMRDILKGQLEGLMVNQIDNDGSLSLSVSSGDFVVAQEKIVAVEARCPDADTKEINDPHINLLLHIANGRMVLLEIYREDSKPILQKPRPEQFELFSRLKTALGPENARVQDGLNARLPTG